MFVLILRELRLNKCLIEKPYKLNIDKNNKTYKIVVKKEKNNNNEKYIKIIIIIRIQSVAPISNLRCNTFSNILEDSVGDGSVINLKISCEIVNRIGYLVW